MKVGYLAPLSISVVNGGLRNQALQTIHHVQDLGIQPFLISPWKIIKPDSMDLVHVFGATVENIGLMKQLYQAGIPMALSPVFYSNRSAKMIRASIALNGCLSWLGSGIRTDFSDKAAICDMADKILPNTLAEAHLIENGFSISSSRITVVPNGVEERFADAQPDLFQQTYGIKDFILFAGQAGAPRKNISLLLKAATKLEHPVVIIGRFGVDAYGISCETEAKRLKNVTLIDNLAHDSEMLSSAYAAAKVFVLPSQFETPGISAMEAALAGSNIVITSRGGTQDYFEDYAEYINPDSLHSLVGALNRSFSKQTQADLKTHLLERFNWKGIAQKTVDVYREILG